MREEEQEIVDYVLDSEDLLNEITGIFYSDDSVDPETDILRRIKEVVKESFPSYYDIVSWKEIIDTIEYTLVSE